MATSLCCSPGERVFLGGTYDSGGRETAKGTGPLRLNDGMAGKSGRRKLCVTDWDGDGRLDLLVNSRNVNFLRNVRDERGKVVFEDRGPLDELRLAGHDTSPTTVDWNGDGVRDLLVGAEDGRFYYLANPRRKAGEERAAPGR